MNSQELVVDTLIRLITTPGLQLRLGILLASGIVAGYILYNGTRDLWRWGILIVLFVVFEEWVRSTLQASAPEGVLPHHQVIPATLAVVTLGIFGLAVGTGAIIKARVNSESYEKKLTRVNGAILASKNKTLEV